MMARMRGGFRWRPVGKLNPAFKGGLISNRPLVERLYVQEKKSLRQVARECGCALRTAARWVQKHGIPTRDMRETLRSRDRRGRRNPNWRGTSVCPSCGGKKNRGAGTCLGCRSKRWRGAGHPSFRGRAEIMVIIRAWIAKFWRHAVMSRDGFRCLDCGDRRGGNLHAHHLKPLYLIVHEALIERGLDARKMTSDERLLVADDLCLDPRVRDLTNGVTLCEDCHERRHRGPGTLPGRAWRGAYAI